MLHQRPRKLFIMANKRKLTLKERRFVHEVVKTRNQTEAAARVYDVKNRKVANIIGAKNMAKASIREAVEASYKREDMTEDWVLKRLKMEAETAFEAASRVKSVQLVGEHLNMFKSNTPQININLTTALNAIENSNGSEANEQGLEDEESLQDS